MRQKLNALFAERRADWLAYGEFSGFKLVPGYQGPRPTGDDFIPYGGDPARLEGVADRKLTHAFRCAMLLHRVDLPGLGGMTTAAHTEADLDRTVAAVAGTLELLGTSE
jgi:glutamate-1-semialdehyde 2,1-aminomutase